MSSAIVVGVNCGGLVALSGRNALSTGRCDDSKSRVVASNRRPEIGRHYGVLKSNPPECRIPYNRARDTRLNRDVALKILQIP
jgi:hypothetical protein